MYSTVAGQGERRKEEIKINVKHANVRYIWKLDNVIVKEVYHVDVLKVKGADVEDKYIDLTVIMVDHAYYSQVHLLTFINHRTNKWRKF